MRCFSLVLLGVLLIIAEGRGAGVSIPHERPLSYEAGAGTAPEGRINVATSEKSDDFRQVVAGDDKKNPGGYAYVEEIENPGSKSAGVRGLLTFNRLWLRGYAGQQLRTPIGSFHYLESQLLWEPQGWFPMADIPVKTADEMIDGSALISGSYKGVLRVGTPEDWCYDPGLDTWYAPELLLLRPQHAN